MAQQRALFLQQVLNQIGSPYRWGGKGEAGAYGPATYSRTFDCSGLVTWAYHASGGPDWRSTHNTDRLLEACTPVEPGHEMPGDLAFYGTWDPPTTEVHPDPSHVMVLAGASVVVGACGGDSSTTTLEAAAARGAKVRARTSMDYRKDFLGVWRLPFAGE